MQNRMMPGGFGEPKPAVPEVQALVGVMRAAITERVAADHPEGFNGAKEFTAVSYKTQVVAGTNYIIKIKIDEGQYIHAKIWKKLNNQPPEVLAVELGKAANDPL